MDDDAEWLHHNAFLALAGTFPTAVGEEAIAELLRSSVEIDPILRAMMANAIAPKGKQISKIRLRLANMEEGKFTRQMRTKLKTLERGNLMHKAMKGGLSWDDALPEAAEEGGCSTQAVEKGVAYANLFHEWCESFDGNRSETNASFYAYRMAFHAAAVMGIDPGEYWKKQKAALAGIVAKVST